MMLVCATLPSFITHTIITSHNNKDNLIKFKHINTWYNTILHCQQDEDMPRQLPQLTTLVEMLSVKVRIFSYILNSQCNCHTMSSKRHIHIITLCNIPMSSKRHIHIITLCNIPTGEIIK